jgi:hypothetical protein
MKLPLSRRKGDLMLRVGQSVRASAALLAAVIIGVVGLSSPVAAQAVCVICSEPDAVYNCQLENGSSLRAGDPRLNLLCITELARAGNHASCSARRQQSGPCEGQVRTVAIGPAPQLAPSAAADGGPQPVEANLERRKAEPPETVEELAKRTANSSKEQLVKATESVGEVAKKTTGAVEDAARKSWDCLSSLFKKC